MAKRFDAEQRKHSETVNVIPHVFVIAGSACHFIAVALQMLAASVSG